MTTSKTKLFCETSSILEGDSTKNKAILRDSFKNGKLLTSSYQCVLRFSSLHVSKVLRVPRKSDARSYEVLHLPRKILANLKISRSKMQPVSGNERPDLLTSLINMSLVLLLPWKMHLCRSSSNVPCLPPLLKLLQTITFC